jgi:N-formylglutamate deformylase
MILHIPHSSRVIDGHIELDNEQANLDYLTDTGTDELFSYWGCDIIKFPLSRFVCDVERLEENEDMDLIGQGIIYRKDVFGNNIKRITPDEQIYEVYHEHHKKLNVTVNRQLAYYNNVIIVDCHSFTSNNNDDPYVCIGTDSIHTPMELVDIIEKHFDDIQIRTSINYPYMGTIIPYLHISNCNVKSVMIELNKNIIHKDLHINSLLEKISEYEWNIA